MDQIKRLLTTSTLLQLIVFLQEQRCSTGVPVVLEVKQSHLVSVQRGDPVTLNCIFTHNVSEADWLSVSWYMTSPGTTDVRYKGNTTHCVPDSCLHGFKYCNASLKIEHVSFKHSANRYICFVRVPTAYPPVEARGQGTLLQVYVPESPPEILITHEILIAEKPSTLYCHALGFYPQNISIKWLHIHSAQASESDVKVTTRLAPFRNFDGTFNATSQMNFTPTLQDHKTICTCQVLHTASKEWIVKNITLNVNYGPQPVIYYRNSILDHFQPLLENIIYVEPQSYLEVTCTTDSNPVSRVIWMKSGGHTERIQLANGVGNSVLLNANTDDSYSGTYICVASNIFDSKERPLAIYVIAAWKRYFTHRFVTVPIFVMTVVFLLLWSHKVRYFLCNKRNTKQLKNQHQWIKDNTWEDVDNQEGKIMTSDF